MGTNTTGFVKQRQAPLRDLYSQAAGRSQDF